MLDEVRAAGHRCSRSTTSAPATRRSPACASCPLEIIKVDRAVPARRARARSAGDRDPRSRILRVAADLTAADVTVEGVETEEQLELLDAHGYRFLQGFLLSRPVPAEQFEPALRGAIVPERSR